MYDVGTHSVYTAKKLPPNSTPFYVICNWGGKKVENTC